MKAVPWILVTVGAGVALYVLLNQPGPQYATGSDDVEDAAGRTSLWGSKQRLAGKARNLAGKAKEGLGQVTGQPDLADEGVADQVGGKIKDVVGGAAQAAGNALHELNR